MRKAEKKTDTFRRKTSIVNIGNIQMGGTNPVRLQSMTNTPTLDTNKTVDQIIRIKENGADYVRLTIQNKKEAEHLGTIKQELNTRKVEIPLIADIHFNPELANIAAKLVDKVRINPGNYGSGLKNALPDERKKFVRQQFEKLLSICKKNHTAIRIGVNHGSLSREIMDEYGDTPMGMAISAMEFVHICVENDFYDVVISMKSSNTRVMVHATRLIVDLMEKAGINFPLHLGVTEAGGGEDGRIKSAVGMGTLLAEGIGDTIRVSLTEDPEKEIPVAVVIREHFQKYSENSPPLKLQKMPWDPFQYNRRLTREVLNVGYGHDPVVVTDHSKKLINGIADLESTGWHIHNNSLTKQDLSPDFIYLGMQLPRIHPPEGKYFIIDDEVFEKMEEPPSGIVPMISIERYKGKSRRYKTPHIVKLSCDKNEERFLDRLEEDENLILLLENHTHGLMKPGAIIAKLIEKNLAIPVILHNKYESQDLESIQIKAACDFGGFFIDGLADGLMLSVDTNKISPNQITSLAFGILQASRSRISKTEYIACPSCGRTNFDIQKVLDEIQSRTSHLKGLKIGVMGCIVNGPGEMADADYGYVGSGKGKVTLYKGKEIVKRSVPAENAVDELIELIKQHHDWMEK